ncbi:MAG: dTMP kinase [Candidatus Methanomethylophilaceae archaeon]|nr:dTMP kinase [Candidatus Methanomethylophilaceae archaeon]
MHPPADDAERLELIMKALDSLSALKGTYVVLVEGSKDIAALTSSGVVGDFICVQSGGGPVRAAEAAWKAGKPAVILTDWDRRGNQLAEDLRINLMSLGVVYNTRIRETLSYLCAPYAKDVESLDSVIIHLQRSLLDMRGVVMGAIIVVEGIDGTGKSTLCARLARELESEGFEVYPTAEPTRGKVGRLIRSGAFEGVSQSTEALLFMADRNDHTEEMLWSASEGKVVLCDRYFASTLAYQSSGLDGSSVDPGVLMPLCEAFARVPDLTILLDADPETTMGRVRSRGEDVSKFEDAGFLRRVRERYLLLAQEHGFKVIDASAGPDEVFEAAMREIREVLRCILLRRSTRRRALSSKGRG